MVSAPVPAALHGPPGSAGVAAGSAEVVASAIHALEHGGTAVDAAVSGAFAAVMSEPVLASLGGGGFLLYAPAGQPPSVLDFFVDAPGREATRAPSPDVRTVVVDFARTGSAAGSSEQVFHGGWGTVAVPGCLDGLLTAHRDWGRLELGDVVRPAVRLAREGVTISAGQRMFLHLVADLLNLTAESKAIFVEVERTGRYLNHAYADLLDAIAGGAVSGVRSAAFADRLLAAAARGGLLTATDLAAYRPRPRVPLERARSGARIWVNPPPSVGGSIVLSALDRLEPGTGRMDAALAAGALVAATGDHRRSGIVRRGTTHISVVDAEGGMAALTLSNGSGSGTVVPHWGVALNNMLGEEDLRPADGHALQPGERMGSMMAPALVELADGARVALGTGGSERIRSAVLALLLRLVDEGRSLSDAVSAPRVHASETGAIHVEPGWSESDLAGLAALAGRQGVSLEQWSAANLFFGGVHAVRRGPDGAVEAVGDARRTGAVGLLRPDGEIARA